MAVNVATGSVCVAEVPFAIPRDTLELSVCIANWNCRELLRACLRSLASAACEIDLEVIVVDNGSTDGAPEMVAAEFPQVVLVRNAHNLGFARANNQALRLAQGELVLCLNNDTEVPPGSLRRLVAYLRAHPDIGMLGPRLREPSGRVQVSYRVQPTIALLLQRTTLLRWTSWLRPLYRRYRRDGFDAATPRDVEVLMGAAVLLRRRDFERWGGWDESFVFGGEDFELSARVRQQARVVFWPGAEIVHHGRSSTRQIVGYAMTQFALGMVRYLRKLGVPRWQLLLYKLVLTLDAPLTLTLKLLEYGWRRLRGQASAANSWTAVRTQAYFLGRGLLGFWQA